MKRIAIMACVVLGLALTAAPSRAGWCSEICYSGYQPWWNIFAKRYKCITPEEERLQKFWHDYYDAMKNYYGALDHIDWVAYYKNHGYPINNGCGGPCGQSCGRINYMPVVVAPSMIWATPQGGMGGAVRPRLHARLSRRRNARLPRRQLRRDRPPTPAPPRPASPQGRRPSAIERRRVAPIRRRPPVRPADPRRVRRSRRPVFAPWGKVQRGRRCASPTEFSPTKGVAMKATFPWLAAVLAAVLAVPAAHAQSFDPRLAPSCCPSQTPNCCAENTYGAYYGPNYYAYPGFAPFNGMLAPWCGGNGGYGGFGASGPIQLGSPSFPTHPYAAQSARLLHGRRPVVALTKEASGARLIAVSREPPAERFAARRG